MTAFRVSSPCITPGLWHVMTGIPDVYYGSTQFTTVTVESNLSPPSSVEQADRRCARSLLRVG